MLTYSVERKSQVYSSKDQRVNLKSGIQNLVCTQIEHPLSPVVTLSCPRIIEMSWLRKTDLALDEAL